MSQKPRGASPASPAPWSGAAAEVRDALLREGPTTLTIRGACMEPWIRDGARVEIRPRRRYWPGDLVAFWARDGRLTVHRLVAYRPSRDGLRLVTQADAAPRADTSFPPGRILGRVGGGECAPEAVCVPLRHRLWALGRGMLFLVHGLLHRTASLRRSASR